jgi:hypothetical protein
METARRGRIPGGPVCQSMANVRLRKHESKIPDLPEYARLWQQVLERRAELVREIKLWDRPDHPAARGLVKIAKLGGGNHGYSARHVREIDEGARQRVVHRRKQLSALDSAIRKGARDSKDERGPTAKQLRDLLRRDGWLNRATAIAALAEWIRGGEPIGSRWLVEDVVRRHTEYVGALDLNQLVKSDRSARARRVKEGQRGGAGTAEKVAERILSGLVRGVVTDRTS